jgi:hypothetical protein
MTIIIRCLNCMREDKRFDYSSQYVFIASTLRAWSEAICPDCGKQGFEMHIQEREAAERQENGNL